MIFYCLVNFLYFLIKVLCECVFCYRQWHRIFFLNIKLNCNFALPYDISYFRWLMFGMKPLFGLYWNYGVCGDFILNFCNLIQMGGLMTPVLFLEAVFRSCIRFSGFGAITLIEGNHDGLVGSQILVTILRYCIYVTLSNFSFRCITYILITRFGLPNSFEQALIIEPLLILLEILLTIVFDDLVGLLFANPARRFIS